MSSTDIRERIRAAGIYQYEVADHIGVSEMTFIRWMRKPLSKERVEKINNAVENLIKEREKAGDAS